MNRYPLHWPVGWKRTPYRLDARFDRDLTIGKAIEGLELELQRLGAIEVVMSSNLRVKLNGWPMSNQAQPSDSGVAVYFVLRGRKCVLACDAWRLVQHNIHAIALHIAAMRGMDRWGVGSLDQAFAGYAALPDHDAEPWQGVLGFELGTRPSVDAVENAYRELARKCHPDLPGGSTEAMARLNRAVELARQEYGT